jgi:hypothetical protein
MLKRAIECTGEGVYSVTLALELNLERIVAYLA